MNLSETIDFCKKNKIKGAMVCVDQAKAFDSVDHNFMLKTFRFFGFGERFISWLLTIGTNRKACIIYDNGDKGNIFSLLRGTAQGDCPSPIIYNICAQILIFKIELSSSIRRVDGGGPNLAPIPNPAPAPVGVLLPVPTPVPVPVRTIDGDFLGESNFETGKNESFADDSTTCTFLDYDDLFNLKNILNNFARLSGLRCNFEKTSLMRIGDLSGEIDPRILDLGFEIVEECNLLGFTFSQSLGLADSNSVKLINKIKNNIRFWTPFNLSISGKLTVAKSLILPVFNYYASVITFQPATLNEIELSIEKFVTKGLSLSKEKIYGPVEEGGLNLFRLTDFSVTLQSFWLKRILQYQHDNWRVKLFSLNRYGPLYIMPPDVAKCGEVLSNILESFIVFRNKFGTAHNNFLTAPILYNENFIFKLDQRRQLLTRDFFLGPEGAENDRLDFITWSNLVDNSLSLKNLATMNAELNLVLGNDKYQILRSLFNKAKNKFFSETDKTVHLYDFLTNIKKGSKKLRQIFTRSKTRQRCGKDPIKKFLEIAGIPDPDPTINAKLNIRWSRNYYGSEMRTFLFKLYHNTLGINSRVAHYNENRPPTCTFCNLSKNLPAERETISHFFWFCPTSSQSINRSLSHLINFPVYLKNFFLGTDSNDVFHESLILIFDTLKYVLWLNKIRYKLPTYHSIISDFYYIMGIIAGTTKKTELMLTDCKFLRRHGEDRDEHD
jgi:hypothetical protein